MVIFQGQDATFWVWVSIAFTVTTAAAVWYFTIVGVDRKPQKQRRGEETVEHFGSLQEDRAPVPKFLIWTYIGVVIWGIAYVLWVGTHGAGL